MEQQQDKLTTLKKELGPLVAEKKSIKFVLIFMNRRNFCPWEMKRIRFIDSRAGRIREQIEIEIGKQQAAMLAEIEAFEKSCRPEEDDE